jgi:hypothetical protein
MTTRLAKMLITSTALAILSATPAFAGANDGDHHGGQPSSNATTILNGQVNIGTQWSTINTVINGSSGDVVIQGQGAGNVLDVTTFNDTYVKSTQDAESPAIGSTINADVSGVVGGVSISGQTFCNSTDVSTDPSVTSVKSNQYCNAKDPASEVNANVYSVGGDVSIASTAYGNTYSEDTNALSAPAAIHQSNVSNVFSTVNAAVHDIGGSVAVTSSAIGNNAQIVHYSTSP